jgi:hypothetical protein
MWEGVDQAAKIALYSSGGAAVLVPSAWPVVATIYCYQCNPADVHASGQAWIDMAGKYNEAHSLIDKRVSATSADSWTGDDRTSFEGEIGEYRNQLLIAAGFCLLVGIIMTVVAAVLAICIILLLFVAMILVAIAMMVAMLMTTGFGIPAAIAEGASAGAPIVTSVETVDGWVTTFLTGVGVTVGGLTLADVAAHTLAGSEYAVTDLVQACVSGLGEVARGALDKLERDLTAKGIGGGGKNWTGPFFVKGLNDVNNGFLFG